MRTVVLKDTDVARTINKKFVCAWKNIEDEAICGGSYGHEITDKPGQCYPGDGEHNTQICVFSADGRLLDAMAGYQPPQVLAAELEWAHKMLKPVADHPTLSESAKKEKLAAIFSHRASREKAFNTATDLRFMSKHAYEPWTDFKADELVAGRGFGDHFFGRFDKSMPGEALGKVPEHQQDCVDDVRLAEISAEAKKLKRQYALAGVKLRAEIKAKLLEMEEEYNELKARNENAAFKIGALANK